MLNVHAVLRTAGSGVGAPGRGCDAPHQGALDRHLQGGQGIVEGVGIHQRLGAEEGLPRRPAQPLVKEGVRARDARVAQRVSFIDVADRHVDRQRRHRHQGLAIPVGRGDGLDLRIGGQHVGAQPDPGGQEREPRCGGLEAELQHAFVEFHYFKGTGLAGGAEVRLQGHEVHGHEAEHQLGDLSSGSQHADIGATVADDGQVPDVGLEQFPNDGHGLAPTAPAADAEGHAGLNGAGDVRYGAGLVHLSPESCIHGPRCRPPCCASARSRSSRTGVHRSRIRWGCRPGPACRRTPCRR